MFVRTKSSPRSKNISVQIVESHRVDGKIKQRVVRHLGTATPGDKLESLKKLASSLIIELKHDELRSKSKKSNELDTIHFGTLSDIDHDLSLNASSLEETKRIILGIHDVYGYIYDYIGFTNPFSMASKRVKSAKILREIVMARIAKPDSKRASVTMLAQQFGVDLNLDHVYQMMDKINDAFCERIQKYALSATLQSTGDKLRVLFYDATTLYFESFTEDSLKKNGYSKDMKFNQPQVLLCLFVTQNGLPVGYELFPGNTFEGHTLSTSLKNLKSRYLIEDVVLVADRGMLNDQNLRFLEDNNYQYIVGAKLKSLNMTDQSKVLTWLDSIDKSKVTTEITHRITIQPDRNLSVKIFFEPPAETDINKIKSLSYVIWQEESKWKMATYKDGALVKNIAISSISSLKSTLSSILLDKKKVSRPIRATIKDLILKYHYKEKILVLSYKPNRALKDCADREKAIQKLQARLKRSSNPKQLISKYGFQKFIEVEGDAALKIDNEKLLEESKWDGVVGMMISNPTLTDKTVISHYRGLWQVEESFRIQKHDLRVRPIYHWTPQRVKAHIAISFIAFVCVRYLEYRVATQSQKISPKRIRDLLMQFQASIIQDKANQQSYLLPSKVDAIVSEIYRVIGKKPQKGFKAIKCSD